ncbi:hypothetical protein HKX48_009092, partial [Thoreauomyces humboldtii]
MSTRPTCSESASEASEDPQASSSTGQGDEPPQPCTDSTTTSLAASPGTELTSYCGLLPGNHVCNLPASAALALQRSRSWSSSMSEARARLVARLARLEALREEDARRTEDLDRRVTTLERQMDGILPLADGVPAMLGEGERRVTGQGGMTGRMLEMYSMVLRHRSRQPTAARITFPTFRTVAQGQT